MLNAIIITALTSAILIIGPSVLAPWAHAQAPAATQAEVPDIAPPRPTSGAGARRFAIRFLTDSEFPPFHYYDEDGVLTGFDVDLARAICMELGTQCDIRALPWNELLPALRRGEADAVIAAQRITPSLLKDFDVTDRYFYTTAWFAGRRGGPRQAISPEQLERRRIAVARGSPHEAYLRTFFRESAIETTETVEQAREAVRQGRADLVFGDGIGLVFWVNGSLSQDCCELKGGPFFEPKFFGDGLAITVPRQDIELKRMINRTLERLRRNGRYEELVLRYFPNRLF
ncbi:MAG: transporter substrate-binding domain-containing protein [Hyphomicrobiaceae bacterium]